MSLLSTARWRLKVLIVFVLMLGANVIFFQYNDVVKRNISVWRYIVNERNSRSTSMPHFILNLQPGHLGEPVKWNESDIEIAEFVENSIKQYGFNDYASSLIPMRRVLPDLRHPGCIVGRKQDITLPKTSIVIVLYNEAWSVLLRTVHSVLDNSPAHLLEEVLLVDDHSYLPFLRTQLEEYFKAYKKVRILRVPERLGLINARIFGSKHTTTPIITFLDAHVECTKGWLEPLLEQIAKNEQTIAAPLIDRIDHNDMHLVKNVSSDMFGAFEWDLNFGWWNRSFFLRRQNPNECDPFESPAMAGGLFSIARRFFERLGWYDEQFRVYGMENAELSIKCWLCGGRILIVPCSHVAHIRKVSHPFIDDGLQNVTFVNSIRLAEVWMDEYKQVVFDVNGVPKYSESMFGSVEERKTFRAGARCKPFQFFLERAYPEMPSPIVPGQFRGEVHNAAFGNGTCLTVGTTSNLTLFMSPCDRRNETQYWTHNFYQELNSYKRCIDAGNSESGVSLATCHRMRGAQSWSYDIDRLQIKSLVRALCLAVDTTSHDGRVKLETCEERKPAQQWYVTLVEYPFWRPLLL